MTREFNKQRRYDPRPSFRDTPSDFQGEERPSGPARSRLNREMVDRAWENGAAHRHPDYHSRQNGKQQGQAPRNAWQKNSYGAPSSPNRSAGNRPYGNRHDTYNNQHRQPGYPQQGQRPFNGDRGPRQQPFNRQNGPARYHANNEPRAYHPNTSWHSGNNGRYSPDNQQRPRHQDRGSDFQPTQPQPYHRGRYDGQRFQDRQRAPGFEKGYNTYNNRAPQQGNFRPQNNGYQTRFQGPGPGAPTHQNRWYGRDKRDTVQHQPHTEQFEGDYERFGYQNDEYAERRGKGTPPAGARDEQASQPAPQRHITRLPDGRALKGPRPIQRRQAQFWNGVSEETSALLKPATEQTEKHTPAPADQQPAQPSLATSQPTPVINADEKKSARRIASAERRKKAAMPKAYPPGPRPSQRGFKWPTT